MAFRRLKFADYLAVKGALAWRPHLFNPKHITDAAICRWGFVPQDSLDKILASKKLGLKAGVIKTSLVEVTQGVKDEFARFELGDVHDFKGGAEDVYTEMADLFSNPATDFREIPLVSPRLSLFLNDCLSTYEDHEYGQPNVKVDRVDVVVQDLSVEFGNIDHYGKWFGVYDGDEIKFHLMGGMLPEVTTANEHTGDHPKRFSASVLATSREKVWFGGDEDEPEDWETNRHYLEFESPTNTVSWRLRNMNRVIHTP